MDEIQTLIYETYKQKPKHFTQILKRNPKVIEYIDKKTIGLGLQSFLEQLYYCINGELPTCEFGNRKQLKSFEGYKFCGKTGICECAKISVSKSVSNTKQKLTVEQIKEINNKREQTTIRKYGVTNNAQTEHAKNQHKKIYENTELVDCLTRKSKQTKLKKYGLENYNNREKAEKTCIEKYGVPNVCVFTEDNQNPGLVILKDKDKLSELFPKFSIPEIATQLNVWEGTVYKYLNQHGFREPYKSTFENEIVFYLNSLGIFNIYQNKRNIINKELDIFLPDYNLAIEYNGVYWHHDKIPHITKDYHFNKFKECENIGIELFTIFGNSWENKKEIWKEKIKCKLKLNTKKIYARKTIIKELPIKETKEFLNKFHIQGYCVSQFAYGLFYNNDLVAVMTFSKNRIGFGNRVDDMTYELVRYATNNSVIGGASKLLKHFINLKSPKKIISYSDNQYSVGNLYKKLGFTLQKENKFGYSYYNPTTKKMYHRYNFAKHLLVREGFDKNKTEREIMDERGFLRIWDCGTRTWVLTI